MTEASAIETTPKDSIGKNVVNTFTPIDSTKQTKKEFISNEKIRV
jgi:hypothetical protein